VELIEELEDIRFNRLPVFFVEAWAKTVRSRASKRVHLEKGVCDFFM
jgi:hypothetical protein